MKKLLVLSIIFFFVILSATNSYPKAEKTGKAEKNIYTDSKFGFQITGLKNWKVKTQKEPSLVRVIMTQKNYKVSSIPGASRYTTTVPSILVLADTTSLSLKQVEKCLLQDGKLLQNKADFIIKLDLIPNSEHLAIHDVIIDSVPAIDNTIKQPYKKTGEDIRERDPIYGSSVIIQDFLAGHVILFKKGKNIYVVQFSCEREFYYPTNSEFQKIIGSWKFTE
ncbi:MAG: hypothetical protein AMJ91_06505 [candidate division Zixibacteria bacterium SM23_73_3]|nr:MAG: hypothetical protein AMJ91_06505 [candidate division Zixibacteria bacterium SM23_73_3]